MAEEINGINSIEPLCTKKAALEQAKKSMPETEKATSIFDKDTGLSKSLIEIVENPIKNSEVKKAESPKEEETDDGKPHYFKHFMYGFLTQTLKLFDNIVEHPIKMGLVIGGTALAMLALPLIGIPSTVGVATLAVIYGVTSLIKTGINLAKFIKHKAENNIEATQKDMEHLGENSLDLALSLPFLPKGIKEVNRFAKYGKIGINHSLIGNINNAQGKYSKLKVFFSGTEQLNADMKTIEIMKQNLSPEQVKEIMPLLKLDNRAFAKKTHEIMNNNMPYYKDGSRPALDIKLCRKNEGGHYSAGNKEIVLNARHIDSATKTDIVATLAHEFQHHKQYILMDRAKFYDECLDIFHYIPTYAKLPKKVLIKDFDKIYKEVFGGGIEHFSPIKPTTHIRSLINANKNYVDMDVNYQAYRHNFLEIDARAAEVPALPISSAKDAFLQANKQASSLGEYLSSSASAFQSFILANFILGNNDINLESITTK